MKNKILLTVWVFVFLFPSHSFLQTYESENIDSLTSKEEMKVDLLDTLSITKKRENILREDKVFKVIENMPRFPGCKGKGMSRAELKTCAESEMMKFVYANMKYPEEARKKRIEGRVVIQFVIDKDGSVTDAKIIRDLGGGCGKEGLRIVNMMPKFRHVGSRSKPVKVQFTVPIVFKL